MTNYQHTTVLKSETVDFLNVKQGGKYIDATLGGAGHTEEILKREGEVLGIDQDEDAIKHVKEKFRNELETKKLILVKNNFKNVTKIAKEKGFFPCQGIVFDLGVSSYHFDASRRGFSFQKTEPLDMRMDISTNQKASDILNSYSKEELYKVFSKKGEIEEAEELSQQIVDRRTKKPFVNTSDLIEVVTEVVRRSGKTHPATRPFMALRLEVNQELEILKKTLNDAFNTLDHKARLCTITFHSGEDRIVKTTYKKMKNGKVVTKKPITPSQVELKNNPRSRSAKLRVIEKT